MEGSEKVKAWFRKMLKCANTNVEVDASQKSLMTALRDHDSDK